MRLSHSEIDWVLFDADHTLFDFDRSSQCALEYMFDQIGALVSEEQIQEYFKINKSCWQAYERGEIDRHTLAKSRFEIFFDRIGVDDVDPGWFNSEYLAQLPNHMFYLDMAEELIQRTVSKYRLGLITNGLAEVQRPRLSKSSFSSCFEVIVVSGEIGLAKPDPAYFEHAHQSMSFPEKSRVLVVGDSLYSDIKGGNDFGYRTCWYNPEMNLSDNGIHPEFEVTSHKEVLQLLGLI